ncbi:hypothetical protein, partial [Dickeya oryzae]|uniref:hypothetical protein n=1 Tax=Dickeya oryzae TaxID=1240404 RepID=UPI001E28E344
MNDIQSPSQAEHSMPLFSNKELSCHHRLIEDTLASSSRGHKCDVMQYKTDDKSTLSGITH